LKWKNAINPSLFVPGAAAVAPDYLDGSLAGDYGWDPLGLGSEKDRLGYYRQAELQNGRWASERTTFPLSQAPEGFNR
jgi:hypothetical protein